MGIILAMTFVTQSMSNMAMINSICTVVAEDGWWAGKLCVSFNVFSGSTQYIMCPDFVYSKVGNS